MVSIRHFTDEQFSDGTTIDGSRLEKALQDLERWADDIPNGDFANRWMQNQIVLKMLPMTADADSNLAAATFVGNTRHAPFLPIYNEKDSANPMRLKGTKLPWNEAYEDPLDPALVATRRYNDQCVWTMALHTGPRPMILDGLDVILQTSSTEYVNDFFYDPVASSVPRNEIPGGPGQNIQIVVNADNPFVTERQGLNSVLFHRFAFSADAVRLSSLEPVGFPDMNPTLGSVTGMSVLHSISLAISHKGLSIPIPPFTRLRFSLVLPLGSVPWGTTPWRGSIPTITATVLEGLGDA